MGVHDSSRLISIPSDRARFHLLAVAEVETPGDSGVEHNRFGGLLKGLQVTPVTLSGLRVHSGPALRVAKAFRAALAWHGPPNDGG